MFPLQWRASPDAQVSKLSRVLEVARLRAWHPECVPCRASSVRLRKISMTGSCHFGEGPRQNLPHDIKCVSAETCRPSISCLTIEVTLVVPTLGGTFHPFGIGMLLVSSETAWALLHSDEDKACCGAS
jgi:hypothetical protein